MLQKISIPDDELILEQSQRPVVRPTMISRIHYNQKYSTCSGEQSDLLVHRSLNLQKGSNKQTRRPLNVQAAFGAKYKLLDRARLRPPMLSPSSNKSMTLKRKVSLPNPRVRTR